MSRITLLSIAAVLLVTSLATAQFTSKTTPHIVDSVYKALLNRSADPASVPGAVSEIQKGNLKSWVDSLVASPEFKKAESGKSSADMLNQIYQGMLGRDADDKGRQAFLTEVGRKQYSDVIASMVDSAEYKTILNKVAAR
jgi:hypothetical protein